MNETNTEKLLKEIRDQLSGLRGDQHVRSLKGSTFWMGMIFLVGCALGSFVTQVVLNPVKLFG